MACSPLATRANLCGPGGAPCPAWTFTLGSGSLFDFPARLLPVSFAGQGLLDPELLTRLEVEGMTLHFLNDVLLLNFAFEAAKGVFQCFTLLKFYFGQTKYTSQPDLKFSCDVLDYSRRWSL